MPCDELQIRTIGTAAPHVAFVPQLRVTATRNCGPLSLCRRAR